MNFRLYELSTFNFFGDVLELVSAGYSNREIAAKLFVSENTIKTHLRNIMDKYHFKNRAQAAAYIARGAWVEITRSGDSQSP